MRRCDSIRSRNMCGQRIARCWRAKIDRRAKTKIPTRLSRSIRRKRRPKPDGNATAVHVWVVEGDCLKAVEIVIGLSDSKYSEVVSGELTEDQSVVTGVVVTKP